MMLDRIEKKYYASVPEEELSAFTEFLHTHTTKQVEFAGDRIEYMSCGEGRNTVLFPPGGGGGIFPPHYNFRSITRYEKAFKVICPALPRVESLDDLSRALNHILDAEGVGDVILVGGSGAGIVAQSYFKRNFNRVKAMVLYMTLAPRPERNKKWGLWLFSVLPTGLFKLIVSKKLKGLAPEKFPEESRGKIALTMAFLDEVVNTGLDKKHILSFIKMAFQFNSGDGYSERDFGGWKGKILIMTSEDDGGFKDTDYLVNNLPNTELHTLPPGAKHLAPLVYEAEFLSTIRDFLQDYGGLP